MTAPLLVLDGLTVRFGGREAVSGVSFALGRERLGIVGESGSGKSLTARAILRLLPPGAALDAKQLAFDGIDLLSLAERQMRALRGRRIALVLQDAKVSLNPALAVGEQIAESCRLRGGAGRREARDKALALLADAQIREPGRVYDFRPHQLSGGMAQRVMIAMMLALDPDLVIADEPTSALDPTVRGQILALLDEQIERRRMGLILISHDLDLVQSFCDRVVVMKSGRIVDHCAADDLAQARDPYTRRLMAARLRLLAP